ncbi:hypothetical protein JW865_02695 [Candidatus Bathyarchaeota archaeon]|nr:hypothetical protein [Candidatus Bathyarchaeota archaeon]
MGRVSSRLIIIGVIICLILSIATVHGLTALNYNTDLSSKADTLLIAVSKINATAIAMMTSVNEFDYDKKTFVLEQYQLGNTLFVEAESLSEAGNYSGTIDKALESMSVFKNVIEITLEVHDNDSSSMILAEEIQALKLEMNRTYTYLKSVESLVYQATAQKYNTSLVIKAIDEGKNYLQIALRKLNEGKINDAKEYLTKVETLIEKLNSLQNNLIKEIETARVERYVTLAKIRVTSLKQNITALSSKIPVSVVSSSLNSLDQAQSSLTAADNYISSGMIKETVDELVTFREKELQTIKILKEAGVSLTSAETVKP